MEKNYNIYRKNLLLPEYGRHIHQMVDHLMEIEDRDERNRKARVVIGVMGNLNPLLRDTPEFTHKLWDHLFIMSDFKLDVDSPYPIPTSMSLTPVPHPMAYPQKDAIMKHYGKYVKRMIRSLEDVEDQRAVQETLGDIARYMRTKSYEYNEEHPNNETIIKDIKRMGDDRVAVDEDALSMIREQIFEREIEVTDEMRQQAQDEYDQYAEQYEAQDTGMTAEEYVIYLGYESVDDYIEKVYLPNYKQQALNAKYMDDDNANFLEEYEPVKAQILQTTDQDSASQALEALNDGDDFAEVTEEYGETTTYDGSEQIVTTQSGLPTAVLTKLNDAEDGTLVNEVIPDTTNGNYYVVRLVSKDYETIKNDVAEALQDNTSLTNDAMVYYLKKYNFTVYDVDIFNALRESNPEYLVQRPDLAEEADDTTATN